MAAVSIIITAARPVAVVGRCLTPIGLTTFRALSNPQALHFTRGGGVFQRLTNILLWLTSFSGRCEGTLESTLSRRSGCASQLSGIGMRDFAAPTSSRGFPDARPNGLKRSAGVGRNDVGLEAPVLDA